ncbi:hypothetical protein [Streptomyces sp. NPDC056244]|uniref:hypothetical protein n=1 Tax=Streptomyces sp. NPDC056244 TaxID=3345762 RepID=UPI0035D82F0B
MLAHLGPGSDLGDLVADVVDPGTGKVTGMEPPAFSIEESELPTPTGALTDTASESVDP